MNINTNKLASNSNTFLKKLKDLSDNKKNETAEKKISRKINNDFFDIKFSNKNFKSRIIVNNKRLSNYEQEITQLQFINEKVQLIDDLYHNKNMDQIESVINESRFNQKPILKEYFNLNKNLDSQIAAAKTRLQAQESQLAKEFKTIEIISQNILSINSYNHFQVDESGLAIDELNFENMIQASQLDNKRVLDLIS